MGMEFELKFSSTGEQQARIRAAYPQSWTEIVMEAVYFDTPEGDLAQRHFTLRRRLENGKPVCTFKAPMGPDARGEWEWAGGDIRAAIPALCAQGCPKALTALASRELLPVCGARFTRQALLLQLEGCTAELALDRGVLTGGGREEPLCEVEIELKSGSPKALAAFAEQFALRFGLTPGPKSKYRRAAALARGE